MSETRPPDSWFYDWFHNDPEIEKGTVLVLYSEEGDIPTTIFARLACDADMETDRFLHVEYLTRTGNQLRRRDVKGHTRKVPRESVLTELPIFEELEDGSIQVSPSEFDRVSRWLAWSLRKNKPSEEESTV